MERLYSVLIVDDESILRNGLKHICDWEKEGFQIIGEAANGKDALEIIKIKEPDIVITDLIMPEIDGVTLTKIIKKDYPNTRVLILSNVSEFEYVKETFKYGAQEYLLKTEASEENIIPILRNIAKEIEEGTVNKNHISEEQIIENDLVNLILNKDIKKEELDRIKKYFHLNNFYLIMSDIYEKDEDHYQIDEIKHKIKTKCNEILSSNIHIVIFIKNQMLIIVNYDKYKHIKVIKEIENLADNIIEEFYVSPLILSKDIDDILNINLAYEESIKIKNKAIYFNKRLISKEDINETKLHIKFDYESFNSYIGKLNFSKCIDLLSKYFIEIKENVYMDEYDLKKFSQNLIYNALNTLESIDIELINISRKKIILFKKIDIAKSFDEIRNIVIEAFKDIENLTQNKVDSRNDSFIVKAVKEYVDKNYKEEISVASISQDLNINYNYLSYCFKNETNENLSSYINKLRVEKAKTYLEDFKIPIADISEIVGFSEHNYFSKIFKKYTSFTPSEYRRMVKINDKKK